MKKFLFFSMAIMVGLYISIPAVASEYVDVQKIEESQDNSMNLELTNEEAIEEGDITEINSYLENEEIVLRDVLKLDETFSNTKFYRSRTYTALYNKTNPGDYQNVFIANTGNNGFGARVLNDRGRVVFNKWVEPGSHALFKITRQTVLNYGTEYETRPGLPPLKVMRFYLVADGYGSNIAGRARIKLYE
ncbi:hypothetical protein [Peptococcus niger]|uniref:DUF5626 domain-containing protein n=1 Tax=Peptococcus niger TaxID=2741 RepID=A0A1G6Z3Q2_PEPNI|nr:hypothetical protein [Peptococcus niger]SDD96587.1 hypothetical protein SAMN04489866_11154 [Peptococcus niger]